MLPQLQFVIAFNLLKNGNDIDLIVAVKKQFRWNMKHGSFRFFLLLQKTFHQSFLTFRSERHLKPLGDENERAFFALTHPENETKKINILQAKRTLEDDVSSIAFNRFNSNLAFTE